MNAGEFPKMDPYEEVVPQEDPNEEHKPKDSDEIKPFEEDKTVVTPPPPRHRRARISIRPQTPMAASTHALVDALAAGSFPFPLPPTSHAYDQAPLGHRAAMIRMRDDILEEDIPPQRRFSFTAPPPGCDIVESSVATARAPRRQGLVRSPGHDTRTIARATDRAEDIGYVRALQASDQRMMTSIKETDRRHIRLEIDVVRGQRTAYETELHESAEDLAVTQMMRIYVLEARARTDKVEDASSSCVALTWWNGHVRTLGHKAAYAMTWGTLKKKMADKYCLQGEIKKLEIELLNLKVKGNDVAAYTQCFQELALTCTKFLANEIEKLANDLMDQKLRTYAERQNENKRKADKNQQQQPHKKQNVARAYTAGPGEKKVYTGDLPLCTKCNYHHTGQCVPKCGKCKRYGHTTTDCQANTNNNNNNKNQKGGACYECGNTGHIKRNYPKLNSHRNGIAQRRAYVKPT
nr:hypothetical protein [Tanacetum cinerariifolium]